MEPVLELWRIVPVLLPTKPPALLRPTTLPPTSATFWITEAVPVDPNIPMSAVAGPRPSVLFIIGRRPGTLADLVAGSDLVLVGSAD